MKLVSTKQEYINKNGEKKSFTRFFVQLDNGGLLEVKPVKYQFEDGTWYSNERELKVVAEAR